MKTITRDRNSPAIEPVTRKLLARGLFVRDLPPFADVVMETLFWGSLSLSVSLIQCSIRMLMLYSKQFRFPCDSHAYIIL